MPRPAEPRPRSRRRQAVGTRETGSIARFLGEGLIILGWVANWRPIEIFLYDWWPITRRRNLYRRLATAAVVLKPTAERT